MATNTSFTLKSAIELLTETQHGLTTFLAGLGLLGNDAAVAALKAKFEVYFANFLGDYNDLKEGATLKAADLKVVADRLSVARDYFAIADERLQALLLEKKGLEGRIDILTEQKIAIENGSTAQKQGIQDKITLIEADIRKTEADLATRRGGIATKEGLIASDKVQMADWRSRESAANGLAAQYQAQGDKYNQESLYWGISDYKRDHWERYHGY